MTDCFDAVKAAAPNLSNKQAKQIVNDALKERTSAADFDNALQAMQSRLDELNDAKKIFALVKQRNDMLDAQAIFNGHQQTKFAFEATGDPALGVLALGSPVNKAFSGSRLSFDTMHDGQHNYFIGKLLFNELEAANVRKIFASKRKQGNVAQELWNLGWDEGSPRRVDTGDLEAVKIAEIIRDAQEVARKTENQYGSYKRQIPGYITRQSHDPVRINRAYSKGQIDEWVDDVINTFDNKRSFDPDRDLREQILESMENIITGGNRTIDEGAEFDLPIMIREDGSIARRASASRKWHPKSADAWRKYNDKWGAGDVYDNVIAELSGSARRITMMRMYGTKPRQNLMQIIELARKDHATNKKIVDSLNASKIWRDFDYNAGIITKAENINVAKTWQFYRALNTGGQLGGAGIASLMDIGASVEALANIGVPWHRAWMMRVGEIQNRLKHIRNEDRKNWDFYVGAAIDYARPGMLESRVTGGELLPGMATKGVHKFMAINLLAPITDFNQKGLWGVASLWMGEHAGRSFDRLPAGLKDSLNRYGISPDDWDIFRGTLTDDWMGRKVLLPQEVAYVDLDAFPGRTKAAREKARNDLMLKAYTAYRDTVDVGVPKPGTRERAGMTLGLTSGTHMGELIRSLGQFLTFPITLVNRHLLRYGKADNIQELVRNMGRAARDPFGEHIEGVRMARFMLTMTMLGLGYEYAKSAFMNKTPPDLTMPRTWAKAFMNGGAIGIYADIILGGYGQENLSDLGGPITGDFENMAQIRRALFEGNMDTAGKNAIDLIKSKTPTANLFYMRALYDYFIFHQAYEAVRPGHVNRMRQYWREDTGQDFIFPP